MAGLHLITIRLRGGTAVQTRLHNLKIDPRPGTVER